MSRTTSHSSSPDSSDTLSSHSHMASTGSNSNSNAARRDLSFPLPPFPPNLAPAQNLYSNQPASPFPPPSQFLPVDLPANGSGGNSAMNAGQGRPRSRSFSEIVRSYARPTEAAPPLTLLPDFWVSSSSANKNLDFAKLPVKQELEWGQQVGEGTGGRRSDLDDDLCSAFLNFDTASASNNSGMKQKVIDVDVEGSAVKTNGNESEGESCINEIGSGLPNVLPNNQNQLVDMNVDVNMSALGGQGRLGGVPPRHVRSSSTGSLVMNANFTNDLHQLRFGGLRQAQQSGFDLRKGGSNEFRLEYGQGEFTASEMEKIMGNEKLSEIALSDPKRVKRILANRLSAARSKERKMKYIAELERKVQNLSSETSNLTAQLTVLQRESAGISSHNNELKFRLQAMEQQAKLKDALNDALNTEVQCLKLAAAKLSDFHTSCSARKGAS